MYSAFRARYIAGTKRRDVPGKVLGRRVWSTDLGGALTVAISS